MFAISIVHTLKQHSHSYVHLIYRQHLEELGFNNSAVIIVLCTYLCIWVQHFQWILGMCYAIDRPGAHCAIFHYAVNW